MYLKCNRRFKDGKEHRYWSLVESRRCAGGRVVQRPVLYLGEINDSQREAWIRSIEAFDEDAHCQKRLTLFASDREIPAGVADAVQVRLSEFELRRPRQGGACWLFGQLWEQLGLREFWSEQLGVSREGTDWEHVLQALTAYRLIDPGSEWRLHRHLLRKRPALPRGRQAQVGLLARPALGLRAGGHRADRDAGRIPAGLRGAPRQYV